MLPTSLALAQRDRQPKAIYRQKKQSAAVKLT